MTTNEDTSPRELDDIDDRAAQLMAQMAARRRQVQEPVPEALDDDSPDAEDDEFDLPSAESGGLEWQPGESDESGLRPAEADAEAILPADDGMAAELYESSLDEGQSVPNNEAPSEQAGRHRSARRMALPPWQTTAYAPDRPGDPDPAFVQSPLEPTTPTPANGSQGGLDGHPSSATVPPAPPVFPFPPAVPLPAAPWQGAPDRRAGRAASRRAAAEFR